MNRHRSREDRPCKKRAAASAEDARIKSAGSDISGHKPVEKGRVAILLVAESDFDVAGLVNHLAKTRRGAGSAALVSIQRLPAGDLPLPGSAAALKPLVGDIEHDRPSANLRFVAERSDACPGNPLTCGQPCCAPGAADAVDGRAGRGSAAGKGSARIKVMVACSRSDIGERLTREPDLEVLGDRVTDCTSLPTLLAERRPNVLLLDKAVLGPLGLESLQAVRTNSPQVRVLLMLDEVRSDTVEEILRNQFDGFMPTGCPPDAFLKAIRAVSQGELWLPRGMLVKAITDLLHAPEGGAAEEDKLPSASDAERTLTARERQIVDLLRHGRTNKEIARECGIMEDTVKKHLQKVFDKLGVRRRTLLLLNQDPRTRAAHAFPL